MLWKTADITLGQRSAVTYAHQQVGPLAAEVSRRQLPARMEKMEDRGEGWIDRGRRRGWRLVTHIGVAVNSIDGTRIAGRRRRRERKASLLHPASSYLKLESGCIKKKKSLKVSHS